eukprot:16659-Heterococcus_DN1.PRE.2
MYCCLQALLGELCEEETAAIVTDRTRNLSIHQDDDDCSSGSSSSSSSADMTAATSAKSNTAIAAADGDIAPLLLTEPLVISAAAERSIAATIRVHQQYWPCLRPEAAADSAAV